LGELAVWTEVELKALTQGLVLAVA